MSTADGSSPRDGHEGTDALVTRLSEENAALRRAIHTLHEIASLVREARALEPTTYALLTGVTAGVGLGFNRAMLFGVDHSSRDLIGAAAVGPADAEEADRIWRSIARDAPDLETLYETGMRLRERPGALDTRVRATRLSGDGATPVALALQRGRCVCGDGSDDGGGLFHLATSVAAPLRSRDRIEGVLYADNRFTGVRIDALSEMVLGLIADHGGRAMAHAKHFEALAKQARTDSLTGLGHHGAMMEAVREALNTGGRVGLAMIDLDDFKGVNDELGHRAGDALLAGVAARLSSRTRADETPFRYGGEEFAVLFTELEGDVLSAIGERLRAAVSDRAFAVRPDLDLTITCSVGVAETRDGDAGALIERADQALLKAKAAGKNRVVVSAQPGCPETTTDRGSLR